MVHDIDVVVVGGGASGLAAAFGVHKLGHTVEVLELASRAGGVIGTQRRDGFLFETGPNSTLDTTPLIGDLLRDVRVADARADTNAVASTRYIVRNGKLVPLPMSPGAFIATDAFSLGAKLRLLREPFIAAAPAHAEESIAEFVRRRLGVEFLDYAVDPFVAGIYAGDPERISVRAAFPRLHALEQRYGSLIKGQIKGAKERRRGAEPAKNTAKSFSFQPGMQALTDALARAVARVTTGVRVERIARESDGIYRVEARGEAGAFVRRSRAVVVATPAYAAAPIVQELAPLAAHALAAIEYAPVAIVASAFRRADVAHPLAGFGFLVPKKERRAMLGTLFSSSMFEGRAPEGAVLLTTFAGGRRDPDAIAKSDDDMIASVHRDLADLVGARGTPLWTEVVRWAKAIPQYEIGHLQRLASVENAESALPGLRFCCNWRGGVALGDCIKSAHATAQALDSFLRR
jgi:protoporphyrinogen/coproporphyrinogen III oxidase